MEEHEYSDDRKSLTQEIRIGLNNRGFWCPNTSGPDVIMAIFLTIDTLEKENEALRIKLGLER
jgi:hypothetical protein